ncbi:SRPBCC domain-containing protein [Kocuria sp. U4B]
MNVPPTGRIESGDRLVLTRPLHAPLSGAWAAVTDPGRLARWYGPWTGDPSSGRVEVQLTAEDGAPREVLLIRRCDPPRHLAVTLGPGPGAWRVDLDLHDEDGAVTLRLSHRDPDPADLEAVGPGWEYYLDRLVAAETGGDPDAVDFARDYHPALAGHYRGLSQQIRRPG